MARKTAAEESGMTLVKVADERVRDLPCSECHDEWIEVLELGLFDVKV